jgi:hypothetical protein
MIKKTLMSSNLAFWAYSLVFCLFCLFFIPIDFKEQIKEYGFVVFLLLLLINVITFTVFFFLGAWLLLPFDIFKDFVEDLKKLLKIFFSRPK